MGGCVCVGVCVCVCCNSHSVGSRSRNFVVNGFESHISLTQQSRLALVQMVLLSILPKTYW